LNGVLGCEGAVNMVVDYCEVSGRIIVVMLDSLDLFVEYSDFELLILLWLLDGYQLSCFDHTKRNPTDCEERMNTSIIIFHKELVEPFGSKP